MIPLMLALATAAATQVGPTRPYAAHGKLTLRSAHMDVNAPRRFHRLELTLDLTATYDNPFDPDQIDVYAVFVAPDGRRLRINGFVDRAYLSRLVGKQEVISPAGTPTWKLRFTPHLAGAWSYTIHAKDRSGEIALPSRALRVLPSSDPGFIRRSRRNPAVFAYADERPVFLVGENMGWGGFNGQRGTYDYRDWLAPLGRAGGNWVRVWMSSWNCALEWSADPKLGYGEYRGVGRYNLANAWKLDRILDLAEQHGISVMVCFGTYGEFTEGGFFGEGQWKANPYNRANGGPCAHAADFWTDPTAQKLYRQRLRYIAARYGCRTSVQSWELWNEAQAPAPWVVEMAQFMKGTGIWRGNPADPYGHLISTTYGDDAIWRAPEIDFTQTHNYGEGNIPDHAPVIHNDAAQHLRYSKPHLMAEFGIDWRKGDEEYDPAGKGVNLHNGLWSAATSGDAGGAMIWWWDGYVHPKNLYHVFTPLREFADAVPWTKGTWHPLSFDPVVSNQAPETFSDLTIPASTGWGRASTSDFIVTPGGLQDSASLPSYLYSPGKPDLRTTPTFRVNYPRPGRFNVRIGNVSASATIRFFLDGRPVRDVALSAAPVPAGTRAAYERTTLRKEYGTYEAVFNKDYGVEVPAGAHTIRVDAVEGDWASVDSYAFTGYRSSRYPNLQLYGMAFGGDAILWAHNAAHNWKNVADKRPIPSISGAATTIRGLPAGNYIVAWSNTETGRVIRTETLHAGSDGLRLRLPEILSDVAASMYSTHSRGR